MLFIVAFLHFKSLKLLNTSISCLWNEWNVPVTGYNPRNHEVYERVALISVYVPFH